MTADDILYNLTDTIGSVERARTCLRLAGTDLDTDRTFHTQARALIRMAAIDFAKLDAELSKP